MDLPLLQMHINQKIETPLQCSFRLYPFFFSALSAEPTFDGKFQVFGNCWNLTYVSLKSVPPLYPGS